jgi:hypothetical protein
LFLRHKVVFRSANAGRVGRNVKVVGVSMAYSSDVLISDKEGISYELGRNVEACVR